MSLRVFYAAGPGNIISAHENWRQHKDDPSQMALTYSGQFADACEALDATAYMVPSNPTRLTVKDGRFTLEHRPKTYLGGGGFYHLAEVLYGLGLLATAVGFRADVAVISSGSTHYFVLCLFRLFGIRVILVLHNTLWPAGRRSRRWQDRMIGRLDGWFFRWFCSSALGVSAECSRQLTDITLGRPPAFFLVYPQFRPDYFASIPPPPPIDQRPVRIVFAGRVEIDKGVFDMIPAIDKMSVSNFSALAAYFLFKTLAPKPRTQRPGVTELLLVMYVIGPVLTSQLNGDHLIIGQRFLPGVGLYDAVSAVEAALISLIPFFLGRRCLTTDADLQSILSALALSGACYSILLLFEVRFSPQLHYWVYGYYPSEFVQTLRDGGFRPMAFMGHGLLAAFFIMASFLSATALWLTRVPTAVPWSGLAGYLGVVLIICKSLGALIYAGFAATLILFNRPRLTLAAASVLITISLGYPIFRFAGLFPTDVILELATSINPDRAGSLKFRLDNEDRLLDRALERPVLDGGAMDVVEFMTGRPARTGASQTVAGSSISDNSVLLDSSPNLACCHGASYGA